MNGVSFASLDQELLGLVRRAGFARSISPLSAQILSEEKDEKAAAGERL